MTDEIFQFGIFEVNARTGELRKGGVKLKVQEQPFQVLLLLISRPGVLVTREEIRLKLWAKDTFVDFDHSLNTAINKLREVLNDSATSPRYIETLARRGYRFIAPVVRLAAPPPSPSPSAAKELVVKGPVKEITDRISPNEPAIDSASGSDPAGTSAPILPTGFLTEPEEVPMVSRGIPRTIFLLIQVMYLIFYISALVNLREIEGSIHAAVKASQWLIALVIVSAGIGIPIRLYLLSSVAFDYQGLSSKFQKIFVVVFLLDELWATSPFLLAHHIGFGLSLAATAALLYLPFSQRTLVFMGYPAQPAMKRDSFVNNSTA